MKIFWMCMLAVGCLMPVVGKAGDELTPPGGAGASSGPTSTAPAAGDSYGLFGALDHRSSYGSGLYPEPFLVDDTDLEENEARLDWLRTNGPSNQHTDLITAEVEKGFGQLTLEVEAPIERDSQSGQISTNFGNVDLGARYPFYQYVDAKDRWDTTFGVAAEVGVPVGSIIARNTEVVPKIFNDLRIENFSLQSILGYSTLIGASGDDGGEQNFEYGFVFGYSIQREQVEIPGLLQLVPVFELNGAHQMNRAGHGDNDLLADAGIRANLESIGPIQPRLGIAYVFPVDYGAHQEVHWGIVTSLVFEY